MDGDTSVSGRCPACGQSSLVLNAVGNVKCRNGACPRPSAVQELLLDPRMDHHVVELRQSDFTLQHPLVERLDNGLFRCELAGWLGKLSGPPHELGKYRMVKSDPGWRFEPLDG